MPRSAASGEQLPAAQHGLLQVPHDKAQATQELPLCDAVIAWMRAASSGGSRADNAVKKLSELVAELSSVTIRNDRVEPSLRFDFQLS
jgi:hypothetical protein